jgi:hypothetical protein
MSFRRDIRAMTRGTERLQPAVLPGAAHMHCKMPFKTPGGLLLLSAP